MIEPELNYFGFADGEFVMWRQMSDGGLHIRTLRNLLICIRPGRWALKKKGFFSPDLVEVFMKEQRGPRYFEIRVCPLRERESNMRLFEAGRNGPFNRQVWRFSDGFPAHNSVYADVE